MALAVPSQGLFGIASTPAGAVAAMRVPALHPKVPVTDSGPNLMERHEHWQRLPDLLLGPIADHLGGPQVWHLWRTGTADSARDFRALRLACSRMARGSAAALQFADLAVPGFRVQDPGAQGCLAAALRALGDHRRFRSLTTVRACCWDAAGAQAVGEAFDADSGGRAITVELVLQPVPASEDHFGGKIASSCSSWPLRWPVRSVRSLVVTPAYGITDEALGDLLMSFSSLEELDLKRCCQLENPESLIAWLDSEDEVGCKHLWMDGCWRLSDEAVRALGERHLASRCHVDLFCSGEFLWSTGHNVEVVILAKQYAGSWVAACLVSEPLAHHGSPEPRFNVLVHETEDFNHAVGFSGRIAFRICRRHLREAPHHMMELA